jgi:hypothetical protein
MEPTINDVLSGRGAWFNQHPGNERFRQMLEEQKVRRPQHVMSFFVVSLALNVDTCDH